MKPPQPIPNIHRHIHHNLSSKKWSIVNLFPFLEMFCKGVWRKTIHFFVCYPFSSFNFIIVNDCRPLFFY